jgi:crotonobetainyl-CoA:carnitine CoA-transferase CaiB-like acyl-CoA transferase
MGADVIKIEDPKRGDYARWMPPLAGDPPTSALFIELNRGKRSVALDLKKKEAQAAVRVLASKSDVLVDSFRPGVLARCGLDPKALMDANPRLIYCAMTGFGLFGPDVDRAGHDIGYLARSGAIAVSGSKDEAMVAGIQVADVGGSLIAVSGILAALFERTNTGRGRVVDVALSEVGLAFSATNFGMLHGGTTVRRGEGVLDGSRPCYAVYRTKDDRFLAVGSLEPKFWSAFVHAIGLPELEHASLDTGDVGAKTKAAVQAKLLEKTRDEWTHVFREVEACVEPVLEIDEVEADPHHRARHIADVSTTGPWVRSPIRLADWPTLASPPTVHLSAAPALGEHTASVLREAGLDEATVKALLPP